MATRSFRYEVLTNTNVGAGRWLDGYRSTDRLVATGAGTVDAEDRDAALEAVFVRYNADDRPNAASSSLSVGDVVVLDGESPFACAGTGWEAIALPPGSVDRDRSWRHAVFGGTDATISGRGEGLACDGPEFDFGS